MHVNANHLTVKLFPESKFSSTLKTVIPNQFPRLKTKPVTNVSKPGALKPPEDGMDRLLLGGAKRSWHVYSEPVPMDENEILLRKIMRYVVMHNRLNLQQQQQQQQQQIIKTSSSCNLEDNLRGWPLTTR
ncbi:hypothetical protein OIU78_028487 [Salix suchowensis]|nr:hypothetical protein OIU78_028487 [Salix suchowensis]